MPMSPAFTNLLLAVADDKLLLGHRNSDWTGLAPILEEDIAFSALAQDNMSHASALYELIAAARGTNADQIAFGREPDAYRCASIVQVPDEFDWATALVRQFFCSHFDALRYARLRRSSDANVAALVGRLAAEQVAHIDHVDAWIKRLGRGSEEARDRLQSAINAMASMACMLFEAVDDEMSLVATGEYPAIEGTTFDDWRHALTAVLDAADLTVDLTPPAPDDRGGRRGVHTPHLKELLDEMCEVFRLEPNAAW